MIIHETTVNTTSAHAALVSSLVINNLSLNRIADINEFHR